MGIIKGYFKDIYFLYKGCGYLRDNIERIRNDWKGGLGMRNELLRQEILDYIKEPRTEAEIYDRLGKYFLEVEILGALEGLVKSGLAVMGGSKYRTAE